MQFGPSGSSLINLLCLFSPSLSFPRKADHLVPISVEVVVMFAHHTNSLREEGMSGSWVAAVYGEGRVLEYKGRNL